MTETPEKTPGQVMENFNPKERAWDFKGHSSALLSAVFNTLEKSLKNDKK